jgi:hypothetical protein
MADDETTGKPDKAGAKTPPTGRDARLKAALKANLAKRKAQARRRADDPGAENNRSDREQAKGRADG